MKYQLVLFILIFTTALFAQKDQLIVWRNEAKPVLKIGDIEKIQELSEANNLELIFKEVNDGVPIEITHTPSIVFQNANGRSFYYGRYSNFSRMENFIRASKLAHQLPIGAYKDEILVWQEGKTNVMAPLKLTELKGEIPKKYEEAAFINSAKKQIAAGMSSFQTMTNFESNKTTRSFYFNLYPYVDDKCNFTIGAEIFCQFNCVKPILQLDDQGLVAGKWKNRNQLFKKAGELIEAHIFDIMATSEIGDAMRSIPENLPTKSWSQLNLSLPILKQQAASSNKKITNLPSKWVLELPKDKTQPFCIFSFSAPLDNYAGEVKDMKGTFTLRNENQLSSAKGNFEVQVKDITMGAEDFDFEIHNKMLNKKEFPVSTFEFETFEVSDDLKIGNPENFKAKGKFTMLGKTIQLYVDGQIMPILNNKETLRLQVNCTFNLPLYDAFRVEGPDGPAPAKNTLQYFMKFNLIPLLD